MARRTNMREQRTREQVALVRDVDQTWRATKMRRHGASHQLIGDTLGISPATSSKRLQAALDDEIQLSEAERDALPIARMPSVGGPRDQAWELRVAGKTYREIAETLEEDDETVRRWILAETESRRADGLREIGAAKELHAARLETLLAANWEPAMRGERDSLSGALKMLEQLAKLQGFNASEKVDVEIKIQRIADETGISIDELRPYAVELARRLITEEQKALG